MAVAELCVANSAQQRTVQLLIGPAGWHSRSQSAVWSENRFLSSSAQFAGALAVYDHLIVSKTHCLVSRTLMQM